MSLCGEARTTGRMFVHIVFAHIQVGARNQFKALYIWFKEFLFKKTKQKQS